jgi:peroxiredoxin
LQLSAKLKTQTKVQQEQITPPSTHSSTMSSSSTTVHTNTPAPALVVPTLTGETFDLAAQNPDSFTIVVFYRGRHCPICIGQLKEVEASADLAKAHGMNVIAISMDTKEKALNTVAAVIAATPSADGEDKKIAEAAAAFSLPIGYGMTEEQARSWGLYMSQGLPQTTEPAVFNEPGIYVMKPDKTVFFAHTQSAPFTRPNFQHLLGGLQFAVQNNYPARGTLTTKG